jgi:putative endonuclease
MKGGWVYIMTNRPFGTLYVGVTNDVQRRAGEHRLGTGSAFARRYHLTRLVFAEFHDDIRDAIARETRFKHWPRLWKLNLIEQQNPLWEDLLERWNQ